MVPISSSVTEAYEQVSRGVINGMFQSLETVVSFNLYEYLSHISLVPGGFAHSSQFVMMSEAAYERLSEADRAALDELTGEPLVRRFAQMWQDKEAEARVRLEAGGTVFHEVSEDVEVELREALAFIEQTWVEEASARGVDGAAALAFYRSELDRLAAEIVE